MKWNDTMALHLNTNMLVIGWHWLVKICKNQTVSAYVTEVNSKQGILMIMHSLVFW